MINELFKLKRICKIARDRAGERKDNDMFWYYEGKLTAIESIIDFLIIEQENIKQEKIVPKEKTKVFGFLNKIRKNLEEAKI